MLLLVWYSRRLARVVYFMLDIIPICKQMP